MRGLKLIDSFTDRNIRQVLLADVRGTKFETFIPLKLLHIRDLGNANTPWGMNLVRSPIPNPPVILRNPKCALPLTLTCIPLHHAVRNDLHLHES